MMLDGGPAEKPKPKKKPNLFEDLFETYSDYFDSLSDKSEATTDLASRTRLDAAFDRMDKTMDRSMAGLDRAMAKMDKTMDRAAMWKVQKGLAINDEILRVVFPFGEDDKEISEESEGSEASAISEDTEMGYTPTKPAVKRRPARSPLSDIEVQIKHPEVPRGQRTCEECLWMLNKGVRVMACTNPAYINKKICRVERDCSWDGYVVKCGEPGALWEPRPPKPDTIVQKLAKKLKHAIRGPEVEKKPEVEVPSFKQKLRELIKGPEVKS